MGISTPQAASRRWFTTSTLHSKTPSKVSPSTTAITRTIPTRSDADHGCPLAFHEPPFTCTNEGWGEFEMSIDMYTTEKAKLTIFHDLNFQSPEYKNDQTVVFKNPSQALIQALRETGPVGNEDDVKANKARKAGDSKKRKFAFDYEKIGDALLKLNEDDLLHVIQMIHDHKSDDTVTNNDIERGEFSVDLFTMPESLTKMIWDFLVCYASCSDYTFHISCPPFSRPFQVTTTDPGHAHQSPATKFVQAANQMPDTVGTEDGDSLGGRRLFASPSIVQMSICMEHESLFSGVCFLFQFYEDRIASHRRFFFFFNKVVYRKLGMGIHGLGALV